MMSKVFRKSLIAVFAVLLAVTSIFGFATLPTFNPTAEEESGFYLEQGASIRIEDDGYIGIKYTTVVNQQWYRDVIKDYPLSKVSFGSFVSISDDSEITVDDITGAKPVDSNYNQVMDICHVSNDSSDKTTSQLIGFTNGVMSYSTTIIFNVGKVYTELKDAKGGIAPTKDELKAAMLERFYKKVILPKSYMKIEAKDAEPVYLYAQNNDNLRSVLVIADNYLGMYSEDKNSIKLPENYADNFFGVITEYKGAAIGNDRIIKGYNFSAQNSSYAAYGALTKLEDQDKSQVKLKEEVFNTLKVGDLYKLTVFNANGDVDRLTIKRGDVAIGTVEELKAHIQIGEKYDGTKTYVLANDLDMAGVEYKHTHIDGKYQSSSNSWVDYQKGFFSGTFDGNGHTIYNFDATANSNVSINESYSSKSGLFGAVVGGTIKNLSLYNVFATEAVYLAANSYSKVDENGTAIPATYENIYIKVSDDTYAPKGLTYGTQSKTPPKYTNVIIQYDVELKGNGKYSTGAIGKGYGVWSQRMNGLDASSSNVFIISPSMVTMGGANGDDLSCLTAHRYAYNEVYLNTTLQKPVYNADKTAIIGGEPLKINDNSLLTKENSVGFWDEETQTFNFVNGIPHNNNGRLSAAIKRFNNVEEFMADVSTKPLGDLGEYWDIVNGVPVWKNLNVEANTQVLVGEVKLTNGNFEQTNSHTIDKEHTKYEVSVKDTFGKAIDKFSIETSEPNFLKVEGNKLYVDEIRNMPSKLYVTIFAEIYGREVAKTVVVNVHNPINMEYSQNEYLYSEFDSELRINDIGLTNITNVWYKDAKGELKELNYNTETGELTGISSSNEFAKFGTSSTYNQMKVNFVFKDKTTDSIILSAKNGSVNEGITLLISANGTLYELNNVIPVYKAIDEEAELDMTKYYDKEYTDDKETRYVSNKYFMLASSITSNGEYFGSADSSQWYITNVVIDGNGNYLKNFWVKNVEDNTKTAYGLFGGRFESSAISNVAFYNLRVTNGSALFSYIFGTSINNVYLDINAKSMKYIGLTTSKLWDQRVIINNFIINCPVAEEDATSGVAFSNDTALNVFGDKGEYADNYYLISKLPFAKVKIAVNDVDAEAKTYIFDAFNKKPTNAIAGQIDGFVGPTEVTRDVFYTTDNYVYYDKLLLKRYDDYQEFKLANNDYSSFTNENGSGCWTVKSGIPVWKDFFDVMSVDSTKFTFTSTSGEGDSLITETKEEGFVINETNKEYVIAGNFLGENVEILNITSTSASIEIDLPNKKLKAITPPTELTTIELTITYKINGKDEQDEKVVVIYQGYDEFEVEDAVYYSQADGEIVDIDNYTGGKAILSAYFIDADKNKVKLTTADGEISGINVTPTIDRNWNTQFKNLVVNVTDAQGNKLEPITLALTDNTVKEGISLYLFCEGACYTLKNVIPTTKVIDEHTDLPLTAECDSDADTAGLQGYVTLISNVTAPADYVYPQTTLDWGVDFVLDGRGFSLKNFVLNDTEYGLFGNNTSPLTADTDEGTRWATWDEKTQKWKATNGLGWRGSMILGLGIIDLEANNSVALAKSLANTVVRSSYIKIKNTSVHYHGLTSSDANNNSTCHHFYGLVYEFLPVYTQANYVDFTGAGATEEMIGQLRPYYNDEYLITNGYLQSSVLNQYQTHRTCIFMSGAPAGKFFANGNKASNYFPKGVNVEMFDEPTDTTYKYLNGCFNAPIKWADTKVIEDLSTTKIANGTLKLPVGVENMAGLELPLALYADSDGAYDIGYGGHAHYSTIDWTNTIIDYVTPENSKIVVKKYENFKPEDYFTTDATVYYPVKGFMTTLKSNTGTFTLTDDSNFIYDKYFTKVDTDENPNTFVYNIDLANFWKNA